MKRIMIKRNAMIYIVIGIILTIAGIIFTGFGTYLQSQETKDFQNTITGLTIQSSEKQDEISASSRKNIELAEKLAAQTEKSNKELTDLSIKNSELTSKLTEMSEDRFRRLTIPSMNVVNVEQVLDKGINSYLKVFVKNTGNNECFDARMYIDRHSSPLISYSEIQSFVKVPKDEIVIYKIPLIQSEIFARFIDKSEKEELGSSFIARLQKGEIAIVIHFHFEYEWNNETLKSSQFSIIKYPSGDVYVSSSKDFVEPKYENPKWKK